MMKVTKCDICLRRFTRINPLDNSVDNLVLSKYRKNKEGEVVLTKMNLCKECAETMTLNATLLGWYYTH